MEYLKFTFSVNPIEPGNEVLIAHLGEVGFESFVENENGFDAFIPKSQFLEEFIPKKDSFEGISFSFVQELIPTANWNEEWEKNFSPVFVEDKLCIRAPFHNVPTAGVLDIVIMPKMSFGTGHHDTTWMMSKRIFESEIKGKSFLDMGCGTGVLAILAQKLGAIGIHAIDIDEWSITNTIENCEVNYCTEIKIEKGDAGILESNKFDFIAANINRNVLLKDIPAYTTSLKSNGKLIMSGFFETDFDKLIEAANKAGLQLISTDSKNGWGLIELEKKV
jgi:ribosomal protein L11 methyltransferase